MQICAQDLQSHAIGKCLQSVYIKFSGKWCQAPISARGQAQSWTASREQIWCIHLYQNVLRLDNKILSNLYTFILLDGWSDFLSIVCQILMTLTFSATQLARQTYYHHFWKNSHRIWGRWQVIDGLKFDCADHLIDMLYSWQGKAEIGFKGS